MREVAFLGGFPCICYCCGTYQAEGEQEAARGWVLEQGRSQFCHREMKNGSWKQSAASVST